MSQYKRKQFWVDSPLQLQMLGYSLVLVAASLLLVTFSVLHGLQSASAESRQIFHSLDWVRDAIRTPLVVSSLIAILASGLVTLIWSHRFAGPLRVLSAAMARIKAGNLAGAVRVRTTDTHQELVKEFAEMQDGLRAIAEKDKKRAHDAAKSLHDALEHLAKDHPARKAVEAAHHEIRHVAGDYHL